MKLRREQAIALLATLLLALSVSLILVMVKVMPAQWPPKDAPQADTEVFFADIDVHEILTDPTPEVDGVAASSAASDDGGTDADDLGTAPDPPTVVTQPSPAPEKAVKPQEPTDPGPTQEEINAQKAAAIRARLGKSSGLNATADAGRGKSETGNASSGLNPKSDGLGLDGRKRLNSPDPAIRNASGTVKVRITVDAAGNVTAASVVSSSGFGEREQEVRTSCLNASRALRYTPSPDRPSQQGTITWNIK